MVNKLKDWVLNIIVHKYALGYLVKAYRATTGYRTYIAGFLAVLVWAGQVLGYVPQPVADELYKIIASIGAVTFMEKLKRYQKFAENVAETVKKEADKPQ